MRLARARDKRDEARRLLAEGIDPGENRKIQNAATVERLANSEAHFKALPDPKFLAWHRAEVFKAPARE